MTQTASGESRVYIDAIGENAGEDYVLRPKQHGDDLPSNAGPLARILRQPNLQELCNAYDIADKRALKAQTSYKFWAKLAIWLVCLAIIFASLSTALPIGELAGRLMGETVDLVQVEYYFRLASIAFLLDALFVAFSIMLWMEWANPYEKWNRARGIAEYSRKELFRAVFASKPVGTPVPGELKALPLKLEYFRRYLLGDQMIYYKKRAAVFRKSERSTRILWLLATIVVFLVMLATFFIAIISPSAEQGAAFNFLPSFTGFLQNFEVAHLDRYILAGGIILAALFGAKLATSLLDKAKGNAIRYENTYINLETLMNDGLELARQKALMTDENAVRIFANRVMTQISAEHQDWVKLQAHERENQPKVVVSQAAPAE